VHEALDKLAGFDERQAKIVEMHFFAGMTVEEIAAALDIGSATVKRDLSMAKAYLARTLKAAH
jgi:RNA polymerase sigma factor (sigma-70 family)